MSGKNENCAVKIAVRERTVRDSLIQCNEPSVVKYHPNTKVLIVDDRPFTFDYILGPSVTQTQVFEDLIKPMLTFFKQGFNCTALAYGQTGTGKSYTMGLNFGHFEGENVGIIPRCLKEIFTTDIETKKKEHYLPIKSELSASFIEIYNEKVYDLLAENANEPIIAKGYRYTGGSRKVITNIEECYAILMQGNKNRHVRPTKMNLQSSRSHAIFTIHLRHISQHVNGDETITSSCMNIVDLAGSEGVKRTGHQGVAMSEGVNINQGLLSIGKVLQAMTMGCKVIPYRDSVLSSVLQDSLNSNSYLTLLACISPHREDLSETLSTLRFAQNAKQLKYTPQINSIIGDMKKNAKLKQTPYKTKPLQNNNVNKVTPLKRAYAGLSGATKSAIKSNTFCTPKKIRMEINRCNQTDIVSSHNRPKLSNVAMNLPKMVLLESTHNRESLFNRSTDSSLLGLNVSSSTTVDGPTNNQGNIFSPVIRKYFNELETGLEKKCMEILQRNMHALLPPKSPAVFLASQHQTPLPSTMRQEIIDIMNEVLSEKEKVDVKCKLFNFNADFFKVPEIPEGKPEPPKTSSPNSENPRISITETFFAGSTVYDKNDANKSIRRSRRISQRFVSEQEVIDAHDLHLQRENQQNSTRRSSRRSIIHRYTERRQSIRLAAHTKSSDIQQAVATKVLVIKKKTSKANKSLTSNHVNSPSTNSKLRLIKHRKDILELLNRGSLKEIQILPTIGPKRAFQIITQRTLNGKFKSWSQVEKLPLWRGTEWERFAEANCLI